MPQDISDSLFPDNPKPPITGVTRLNAAQRLAAEPCPLCGKAGQFILFERGPHIGIGCTACNKEHPFRSRGLMWVPRGQP